MVKHEKNHRESPLIYFLSIFLLRTHVSRAALTQAVAIGLNEGLAFRFFPMCISDSDIFEAKYARILRRTRKKSDIFEAE